MKRTLTDKEIVEDYKRFVRHEVALFTSKELARKARKAVMEANKDIGFPKLVCGDIKETPVYECEEEVPILNNKKYGNNQFNAEELLEGCIRED